MEKNLPASLEYLSLGVSGSILVGSLVLYLAGTRVFFPKSIWWAVVLCSVSFQVGSFEFKRHSSPPGVCVWRSTLQSVPAQLVVVKFQSNM